MEQTISFWNYNRRSMLNAFPHFNVSLEVKQSKILDEPLPEAKVRVGKIEPFQAHGLINTDREESVLFQTWCQRIEISQCLISLSSYSRTAQHKWRELCAALQYLLGGRCEANTKQ